MNKRLVKGLIVVALAVPAFRYGPKLLFIWLNAAVSERSFSTQWRIQGGKKGFFGTATDLELVRSPDSIIAEEAASRFLTARQCQEEDGMINHLATEDRPGVQRWILQALAACGSKKAVPLFMKAIRSENSMIALVGAQSLGMLDSREDIPGLEHLVEHCAAQCAGTAALTLSKLGERRVAYPWAINALSAEMPGSDPRMEDHWKRRYAMQVLGKIGDPKDIPLLEKNRSVLAVLEYPEIETAIRTRGAAQK